MNLRLLLPPRRLASVEALLAAQGKTLADLEAAATRCLPPDPPDALVHGWIGVWLSDAIAPMVDPVRLAARLSDYRGGEARALLEMLAERLHPGELRAEIEAASLAAAARLPAYVLEQVRRGNFDFVAEEKLERWLWKVLVGAYGEKLYVHELRERVFGVRERLRQHVPEDLVQRARQLGFDVRGPLGALELRKDELLRERPEQLDTILGVYHDLLRLAPAPRLLPLDFDLPDPDGDADPQSLAEANERRARAALRAALHDAARHLESLTGWARLRDWWARVLAYLPFSQSQRLPWPSATVARANGLLSCVVGWRAEHGLGADLEQHVPALVALLEQSLRPHAGVRRPDQLGIWLAAWKEKAEDTYAQKQRLLRSLGEYRAAHPASPGLDMITWMLKGSDSKEKP